MDALLDHAPFSLEMTYESQQTRIFVLDYLTNSLTSTRNVYVKTKVLKLLLALLQEGHTDFHLSLRKSSACLRETAVLRTSNTDLAGDVGRIRDLANKVLDVLFNTEPVDRPYPFRPSNDPIIDNILGPQQSQGRDGGSLNKYEGFGNPTFSSSKPAQSGLGSSITRVVGKIFESPRQPVQYDSAYATTVPVPQRSEMGGVGGGPSASSPFSRQIGGGGQQFGGMAPLGEHRRGRPGGGWDDDDDNNTGSAAMPETSPQLQLTESQPQDGSWTNSGAAEYAAERERRLVDEITAPGGIKPAPPRDALNNFVSRCKSLDCLAVVQCLREKLAMEDSHVTLRALFVVEALARSDVPNVLSYLDLTLDELSRLTSSGQASIQAKANKLLRLLSTVDSSSTATTAPTTPSSNGASSNTSTLLALGNGKEEELTIPSNSSSGMSNLFKGLAVSGAPAAGHASHGHAPTHQSKQLPGPPSEPSTGLLAGLMVDMTHQQGSSQWNPPLAGGKDLAGQPPSAGPESPSLLDFEQDRKTEFDPLAGGSMPTGGASGRNLLSELSSLEAPAQSPLPSMLLPTQTTPLVSAQTTSSSAFGLTTDLAPPTGTNMAAYGTGLGPSGSTGMNTSGMGLHATSGVSMSTGGMPVGMARSGVQPLSGSAYSPVLMNRQASSGGMLPGMHMSPPVASGENRPVQRPPPPGKSEGNGGFGFLGKSSKNSAFDFVQDEMKLAGGSPSTARSK